MRIICFRSCSTTIGSRTHIVDTCKSIRDDQDVLMKEMKNFDECDMEELGRLSVECIEEMISIFGDILFRQTDKQEGDRISKQNFRTICKMRNERPTVGGVAISSKNGPNFQMVCVANVQTTNTRNKRQAPTFD